MSVGYELGEVHWQIEDNGTIKLGVQGPPKPSRTGQSFRSYRGPMIWNHETQGRWMHLAVVYDRTEGTVIHHINGQPVSLESTKPDPPLRLGETEIGNWSPGTFNDPRPIRNLNGAIDELAVFARPLAHAEIEKHYRIGLPRD